MWRHGYAFETYLQDNWKVAPKLTLNLGLRYAYQSPYVEQNDRAQNFIIDPDDSRFGTLVPTGLGVEGRSFRRRDLNDWGPRVALAYQASDKTVIRAGYGVFYVGTLTLPVLADLTANFERRFNDGFSILSGFTWSKTLVKQLGQRTSYWHLAPENTIFRQRLPQRHFFAGVWDLPPSSGRSFVTDGPLAHVIGGWQLSPIFEAQRGPPLSAGVAGNPATSQGGQRPNRIGDGNLPRSERTPERWLDIGAFEVPDRFTFGNAAAWIIGGPGLVRLNPMISRTFALSERFSLDFRTEFFNVFNAAHFNFPNGTINRPAGGRISSTMECCPARQIQFGMKLIF